MWEPQLPGILIFLNLLIVNNFDSQDFNHYPFLTQIYITYIILTEIIIIIIFNSNGVTAAQLTTFVPLYCCNNITMKMTATAAETMLVRK